MKERRRNWKSDLKADKKSVKRADLFAQKKDLEEQLRGPLVSFSWYDSLKAKLREIVAKLTSL